MPASTSLNPALDDARRAGENARGQLESTLSDLARRAEKAVQEGLDALKSRTGDYTDTAQESLESAQKYVSAQVQERPLTTTLAALGVGVILGFLLSGGRR